MSVQVFVDEGKRGGYLLCAAIVPTEKLADARRVMRELKPGNRWRLHMHSEGTASRRRILAEFSRREPIREAHLWIARIDGRPERQVRDACFHHLAQGVAKLGATSIVVESCAQDVQDQRVIAAALAEIGALNRIRFDIVAPSAHEMLWAADIVAWAYAAGGTYRQAINKFVTAHEVG